MQPEPIHMSLEESPAEFHRTCFQGRMHSTARALEQKSGRRVSSARGNQEELPDRSSSALDRLFPGARSFKCHMLWVSLGQPSLQFTSRAALFKDFTAPPVELRKKKEPYQSQCLVQGGDAINRAMITFFIQSECWRA